MWRAHALLRKGRYASAVDLYARAVATFEDHGELLLGARARANLALGWQAMGRIRAALRELRRRSGRRAASGRGGA